MLNRLILFLVLISTFAAPLTAQVSTTAASRFVRKTDAAAGECNSTKLGTVYYSLTINQARYCNGSAWTEFGDAGVDTTAKIGSLRFDSTAGHHVNHGMFWIPGTTYSHFFIEAWIKAVRTNITGYIGSAGYGGGHELLFGVTTGTTHATLTGKYYGGSDDYSSGDSFPLNQWTHVAMGWDGTSLMFFINGSLSAVHAVSADRETAVDASNGLWFVGGSDHNGFDGYIAQVRLYDGEDLWRYNTDFFPERYFRPLRYVEPDFTRPQFLANYMTPATTFIDQGEGFDPDGVGAITAQKHDGVLGSQTAASKENVFFTSDVYPTWVAGDITAPTYARTPPATPDAAIVFDSFSRKDTTYAFYPYGTNVAGSTEAGSAGVKVWSVNGWPIRDGRMAYWNNLAQINTVDVGVTNARVCVDRINNSYVNTGLTLRYVDASNFVNIQASPTSVRTQTVIAGVVVNVDETGLSSSWTTLCGVINGAEIDVFRDATEVQSNVSVPTNAGTRHGLYAGASGTKAVSRYDNFTVTAP